MGTDAFGMSIKGIAGALDKLDFVSRSVYVDKEPFSEGDYSLPAIARLVRNESLKTPLGLKIVGGVLNF